MSENGETGIGIPQISDIQHPLEIKRDSREDVINAFNSAFELLDKTPEENLTAEEQWIKESIRGARSKTIDYGKDTFTNSFENHHTGEVFTQEEGIPIEGLLEFLKKRTEGLPPNSDGKKDLIRVAHILYRNSQPYHRFPHRIEPSQFEGRVHYEAYLISKDSRTTGNENEDWFKAIRTLNGRIELIIPKGEEVFPSTRPVIPVSETVEPTPAEPTTEKATGPASSKKTPIEPAPAESESEPEEVVGSEPEPETIEQIRREFMIVNRTTDIYRKARELAEEQLQNEMRRGNALNPLNWPRKIGLRIMEEFHRQRYIQKASRAMLENNNSYLSMNVVRNAALEANHRLSEEREAGQAVVAQLKTGRLREGQTMIEVQGTLREEIINNIIRPVIEGHITNQEQIQQTLRDFVQNHQDDPQVQAVFGRDATQFGRLAEYFVSDLLETGELVRGDIAAHRYTLEQLDSIVQIRLANTSWGAETEIRLSAVDRAVAWAERHRLTGTLINPATLGAVFSIATFGIMRGTGFGARVIQFVVPGVGLLPGALFAAARRNYDLKIDKVSHQIERAYNRNVPERARRREALEQFSYNTAGVDELINGGGQEILTGTIRRSLTELLSQDLSEGQTANREAVIRRIAEIQSRLDFSSREHVDLIRYLSREQVEQGRLVLIRSIIEATQALRNAGMPDEEIQEIENRLTGEWNSRFTQNREQQERAFAHYRLRNAAGAAVFGGVAGLAGGYAIKEALEHSGVNLGEIIKGAQSKLKDFKEMFHNKTGYTEVGDYRFEIKPDNSISVIDQGSGNVVLDHGISLQENGHLLARGDTTPPEFLDELHKRGFGIETGPELQNTILNSEPGTVHSLIGGKDTLIPYGTHWVENTNTGEFDLVIDSHPDRILVNDYNPTLHALDQGQSIIKPEITINEELKPVFGADGIWDKNGTEITRQWYGNNTSYSDFNELKAYNSVFTTSDGQKGVVWDMSQMQESFQNGNVPPVVDVQGVVRQGDAVLAFSSAEHQGNPIIISDASDAIIDGKFTLDPTDNIHHIDPNNPDSMTVGEFSKLVLNQQELAKIPDGTLASELLNHRDVFNLGQNGKPGFIEAGQLVKTPEGNILNVFATGLGTGETPTEIAISHEVVTFNLNTPIIDHINTFDIIPPGEDSEIPIIPIPFAPRHPLERLFPPPIREASPHYEAYTPYGKLSPEARDFYKDRLSERIRNDPNAILDPETEINDYLKRQPQEYLTELNEYLSQEQMEEPMNDQCEAAICIPVYSLGEGQIVQNALEQYLLQIDSARNKKAVDPNKIELILFLNYPRPQKEELENRIGKSISEGAEDRVRNGNPEPYDTEEVIRQFMSKHPELKIRVMKKEFDQRPHWGKIIKPLYDIALMRSVKRDHASKKDILIITNDIDVIHMSPGYIRSILNTMEKERLEGVVGKIDMPNHGYEKYPGFLAAMRLYQFLDSQLRHKKDRRVITQGRNSVIRGSIYAAIGGVNQNTDAGADTELGAMINYARNNPNTIGYLNRAWLHTDPRRELDMWLSGVPLPYAWDRWAAMDVYGSQWDSRFNIKSQNPSKIDKDFFEREIYFEMERWGLNPNSKEIIRALYLLGLKPSDYHIGEKVINHPRGGEKEVETIIIDNFQGIIEKLKKYIEEERWEAMEKKIKKDLTPSLSLHVRI